MVGVHNVFHVSTLKKHLCDREQEFVVDLRGFWDTLSKGPSGVTISLTYIGSLRRTYGIIPHMLE